MKSVLGVTTLVGLSVAIGYFVSHALRSDQKPPVHPPVVEYTIPKKLNRLYQEPRQVVAAPTLSEPCQQFLQSIAALDLSQEFKPPSTISCTALPAPLDAFHSVYLQRCQKKDDQCLTALYQYRAQITHYTTKEVPLNAIRDPKVLIDKLLATFEKDSELAAAIADRWSELDPDNYPAQKAGLISTLLQTVDKDPNDPKWSDVVGRLERMKRLEPKDSLSHAELDCFITALRDRNPDKDFQKASDVNTNYPTKGAGPYLMARAENLRGNRQASIDNLRECLRREPANPHCTNTVSILTRADPRAEVKNAFTMYQSFPLSPQ